MKIIFTNILVHIVLLTFLFSCTNRVENEVIITDDADFQPTTEEVLIEDDNTDLNACYFENNDLKLIYAGANYDSLQWLKKNANDTFLLYSTKTFINIAQVGAFQLKIFKTTGAKIHSISVYTCPSSIETVPSAFTPNNDGKFDTWAPIGKGVKTIVFTITSMDNEKLFESTSLDNAWDGTFEKKPVPTGSYKYEVTGTLRNGKAFTYRGILSLSR